MSSDTYTQIRRVDTVSKDESQNIYQKLTFNNNEVKSSAESYEKH